MSKELSKKELDDIFYGKPRAPDVSFYDHEVVNPVASHEAGRRITEVVPYLRKRVKSENVDFCRRARQSDRKQFPDQWAAYIREKKDEERPAAVSQAESDIVKDWTETA